MDQIPKDPRGKLHIVIQLIDIKTYFKRYELPKDKEYVKIGAKELLQRGKAEYSQEDL